MLLVVAYYTYNYTNRKVFTRVQQSIFCKEINSLYRLKLKKPNEINHNPVPADNDIHKFDELLDMIDGPVHTSDYNIPQVEPKRDKPTQSVVELPKPYMVPSSPLEDIMKIQSLNHSSN